MLRAVPALFALLALASCSQTTRQETPDPRGADRACAGGVAAADLPAWVDAPNFQLLSARVASAGPPTLDAIAGLRERGYGMVIDLRTAEEPGFAAERAAVEAEGLRYVHIPVRGLGFDLTDAARLRDALEAAPPGSVLLHCGSGARAGALWGLAQGLAQGMRPYDAAALAHSSGRTVSDSAASRVAEELQTALPSGRRY